MDGVTEFGLAAIGGGIGASLRWGAGVVADRWNVPNWLAIMGVNTIGCLAMGAAIGSSLEVGTQAFLMAGVLGGFTTFSTAMLDAWLLWRFKRRVHAALCLLGTPVLAMVAVAAGWSLVAGIGGHG